ncbi:MAG: hypothetical protein LBH57_09870 [Treponema sp.]|nr:hypothetical protein [Treponema sp.]
MPCVCVLGCISVPGGRVKLSGLILEVILFDVLTSAPSLVNVSPFW